MLRNGVSLGPGTSSGEAPPQPAPFRIKRCGFVLRGESLVSQRPHANENLLPGLGILSGQAEAPEAKSPGLPDAKDGPRAWASRPASS